MHNVIIMFFFKVSEYLGVIIHFNLSIDTDTVLNIPLLSVGDLLMLTSLFANVKHTVSSAKSIFS